MIVSMYSLPDQRIRSDCVYGAGKCGNVASYKLPKKKYTVDPLWTVNRFSFRTTPVHRLHFVFTHSLARTTTKRKL